MKKTYLIGLLFRVIGAEIGIFIDATLCEILTRIGLGAKVDRHFIRRYIRHMDTLIELNLVMKDDIRVYKLKRLQKELSTMLEES